MLVWVMIAGFTWSLVTYTTLGPEVSIGGAAGIGMAVALFRKPPRRRRRRLTQLALRREV